MWDKLDTYVAEKTRDEYAARLRRAYHEPGLLEHAAGALWAAVGRAWRAVVLQRASRPRGSWSGQPDRLMEG
ncbi:MAG: hypothetical protein HPY64_05450 [Anaerolineae bacterium]|nr:hypothetical protein [Anaerolineae bacterium]